MVPHKRRKLWNHRLSRRSPVVRKAGHHDRMVGQRTAHATASTGSARLRFPAGRARRARRRRAREQRRQRRGRGEHGLRLRWGSSACLAASAGVDVSRKVCPQPPGRFACDDRVCTAGESCAIKGLGASAAGLAPCAPIGVRARLSWWVVRCGERARRPATPLAHAGSTPLLADSNARGGDAEREDTAGSSIARDGLGVAACFDVAASRATECRVEGARRRRRRT